MRGKRSRRERAAEGQRPARVDQRRQMRDGPFTLSSAYKARALSIAKARVALAGARLLNTALR